MHRAKSNDNNIRISLKLLFLLLILGMIALAATAWWLLYDLPPISRLEQPELRPTTQILDRNGELLYEVLDTQTGRQLDLTLDQLPQACIQATLATEDRRFYMHAGFDPVAIARAAWQNYRAGGEVVSGGSTLTQQLVRILLFDQNERYEQSYRRKLREAWLAWRLEQRYSKDELLALYLNQSYYGYFAFGLEAAAQTFFAKPADQLSRAECALIAGLVQYPTGYNPLLYPDVAKARQLTVLRLMREAGYLSAQQADVIAAEPLRYRSNLFDIDAPHFVMYVQDLAARAIGRDRFRLGGLRIVTTLDVGLQREAEQSVRRRLDLLNCRTPGLCTAQTNRDRRVDNASAVVLDAHSGEILAMVGSPDYFDAAIRGNVNAALTLRQPGSAIKPFTYAAAMDPGWSDELGLKPLTAASVLADVPTTFYVTDEDGGNVPYLPVNYDRKAHGPVSVRTALANSYNIPAVKTLDRIGVETLRRAASESGISSLTGKYGLALTLGGGEVRLLDLAAAYGVFEDGFRLEPVAILDIQQRGLGGDWSSLLDRPTTSDRNRSRVQVFEPETAFLITDILSDDTARVASFGEGSVLDLPFPAAVKTGTTTDWRDNWTVGYSTERIAGVWVGNADNTPMLDVSGVDGAGPIWRDLMLLAHRTPPAPFTVPPGIARTEVCVPSGMLPSPACSQRRSEYFIRGTEPVEVDNQFLAQTVDVRTGALATDDTPAEYRSQVVRWNAPVEYREWAAARGFALAAQANEAPASSADQPAIEAALDEQAGALLRLDQPVSNTAYQVHPRLPAANQRLRVRGESGDGATWNTLRLVVDGTIISTQKDAAYIENWWTLSIGEHRLWVEGERSAEGDTLRSIPALVVVREFENEEENPLAASVQEVAQK